MGILHKRRHWGPNRHVFTLVAECMTSGSRTFIYVANSMQLFARTHKLAEACSECLRRTFVLRSHRLFGNTWLQNWWIWFCGSQIAFHAVRHCHSCKSIDWSWLSKTILPDSGIARKVSCEQRRKQLSTLSWLQTLLTWLRKHWAIYFTVSAVGRQVLFSNFQLCYSIFTWKLVIIIRSEPHSGTWLSEWGHSRQSNPVLDARRRKGRCWLVSGQAQQCGSTCVPVSLFASSSPVVGHERQRTEHGSDPTLG